jgi:DNA recombination protein RmuC
METAQIILLSILVVGVLIIIALLLWPKESNQDNQKIDDLKEKLREDITVLRERIIEVLGDNVTKSSTVLSDFNAKLQEELNKNFDRVNKSMSDHIDALNKKVDYRLNEGFDKTNKTFNNILETMGRIDEAQKNIQALSGEVVSLQNILSDKKSRGTFGEVQLSNILENIFGENNKRIFELQATLSNGSRVDALIHIPDPMGDLPIDSKFPLENYQRMVDMELSEPERKAATKAFKGDVKTHINAIANKYIIANETAEQAIMFLPAESIFAEINAYHNDLITYAQNKQIFIASPTTLMSFLTTVQVSLRNLERNKHAKIIQEELLKLSKEFDRYKERWDGLQKSITTVSNKVKEINTTTDKISKRFTEISKVELEETKKIDAEEI